MLAVVWPIVALLLEDVFYLTILKTSNASCFDGEFCGGRNGEDTLAVCGVRGTDRTIYGTIYTLGYNRIDSRIYGGSMCTETKCMW